MKRTAVACGILAAALAWTGASTGASAVSFPAPVQVDAPNHAREVAILREAYDTLEKADHDYKGHRRAAMNHIEKACRLLGLPIKGDGKGRQPQPVSDSELREAQGKVEAVRHHVAGSQPQIATELDAAIKQISIALTIR